MKTKKIKILVDIFKLLIGLKILALIRLEKLKDSVKYYVVQNKFNSNYIVKAEEWHFVSHIIELLESFCIVKQQCIRNNELLSTVFPHAKLLFFLKLIVHEVKVVLQS